MKCPWCWKVVTAVLRIDRDPDHPHADVNGAPFLCERCTRLSIVDADGRALRKPNPDEERQLADAIRELDRYRRSRLH